MKTRLMPLMLVAALLACASSCAKPDWVQQTLVTADVTGVWVGSTSRPSGIPTIEVRLELEQEGLFDRYHITSPADLQDVARRLTGTIAGTVSPSSVATPSVTSDNSSTRL